MIWCVSSHLRPSQLRGFVLRLATPVRRCLPTVSCRREYGKADRRWAGRDPGVISLEILTVVLGGPAAALCAYAIVKCGTVVLRHLRSFTRLIRAAAPAEICVRLRLHNLPITGGRRGGTRSRLFSRWPSSTEARPAANLCRRRKTVWEWTVTAALHAGWMTFAPEWLDRSPNLVRLGAASLVCDAFRFTSAPLIRCGPGDATFVLTQVTSNPLYLWIYLFFMNVVWVSEKFVT